MAALRRSGSPPAGRGQRLLGWIQGVALCLTLTGCESLPTADDLTGLLPDFGSEHSADALWEARLTALAELDQWSAVGRLGLRYPGDSITANVDWRQRGEDYRIELSGPFGQGQVRLLGTTRSVSLETAEGERVTADSAEALVKQQLGWELPVSGLSHWLLGRPDPALSVDFIELDDQGRPTFIEQGGWRIEYRRFADTPVVPLPARLDLSREDIQARVLVSEWQLNDL